MHFLQNLCMIVIFNSSSNVSPVNVVGHAFVYRLYTLKWGNVVTAATKEIGCSTHPISIAFQPRVLEISRSILFVLSRMYFVRKWVSASHSWQNIKLYKYIKKLKVTNWINTLKYLIPIEFGIHKSMCNSLKSKISYFQSFNKILVRNY